MHLYGRKQLFKMLLGWLLCLFSGSEFVYPISGITNLLEAESCFLRAD